MGQKGLFGMKKKQPNRYLRKISESGFEKSPGKRNTEFPHPTVY